MEYNFTEVEKKWQQYWAENKTFRAETPLSLGEGLEVRPKYYVLDMFPYPSGAGLHVGHPLGYIASDIYARFKRLNGFNVLHPMGYDSFGLPAEQYAIQTGQHPNITTKNNISRYREQLDKIGFSFDWEREVRTSDPEYYKWTQWIFIKLFNSWYNPETNKAEPIDNLISKLETGNWKLETSQPEKSWSAMNEKERSDYLMQFRLAYLSETFVNWCPQLGTVLANEEVKDGVSERGGYPVERKLMPQWSLRITAYAGRLLNDLEKIDWSESIKEAQRNWIGKSEGSSLRFYLSPNPSPPERGTPTVQEPMSEYFTTDSKNWHLLIDNAKKMRSNPTKAEKILWEQLRAHRSDFKIRRQHIIDKFIVDFVCLSRMTVIEVDGDIHDLKKEEDEQRTAILNECGFTVIRFSNEEVINHTSETVKKIVDYLNVQKIYPNNETEINIFKEAEEEYTTSKIKSRTLVNAVSGSPSLEERELEGEVIEVFTTRPDTVFGVSFVTLAPEHELIEKITPPDFKTKVQEYVDYAKNRSERDRMTDVKKITGEFTGAYAVHPFTGKQIPIWIGEYVLAGYGTGAVMGVPGHDERDYAFAKHFGLPILQVVKPIEKAVSNSPSQEERGLGGEVGGAYDAKEGKLVNSDFLNGLEVKDAIKKAIAEIEKKNLGKGKTNYRLRDAIFGRQRYWGEPIPVYYKNGIPHVMDESELPLILPEVDKYLPTETGEPPLARAASSWKYQGEFEYEKTTMPGWAGSSWYYLRYMDAHNKNEFASKDAVKYWQDVDLYIGGAEHATGHLLYVRFWTKFLFDLGYIPVIEPAKKLINQGMIQGVSEKISISGFDFDYQSKFEKRGLRIPLGNEKYFEINFSENFIPKESIGTAYSTPIIYSPNMELSGYFEDNFSNTVTRNVPIEFVQNNKLDITSLTESVYGRDYKKAIFICEGGFWFENKFTSFGNDGSKDLITKSEVEKMSKSKLNVVTPDDIIEKHGADCLRMYEMFLGPLEQSKPWNTNGIAGVSNFIRKLWRLYHSSDWNVSPLLWRGVGGEAISDAEPTKVELKILHKTIRKVQEDIEKFSFNTSVSSFMICVNELTDLKCNKRAILEPLAIILSPYAPHIAEELWSLLGHKETITYAKFPEWKEEFIKDDSFEYPVSVNGKTRFKITMPLDFSKEEIESEVMTSDEMKKYLNGNQPKKIIVVPGRIVNVVL